MVQQMYCYNHHWQNNYMFLYLSEAYKATKLFACLCIGREHVSILFCYITTLKIEAVGCGMLWLYFVILIFCANVGHV